MNKVILLGRLTKNPEPRMTQSGKAVCGFTLAVDIPGAKSKGAEKTADFIRCIAWGKTSETICQYCEKGSAIAVDGRLSVRSYTDTSGQNRIATEVVVERFDFAGSKPGNNTAAAPNYGGTPTNGYSGDEPGDYGGWTADDYDDAPF